MQKQELEVQVGDTLQIGDYTITIVDVDGDDAAFRIDAVDEFADVDIVEGIVTLKR